MTGSIHDLNVGDRVYWHDPDRGLGSGPGTVTAIYDGGEMSLRDDDTIIYLVMDSGSEVEVFCHELSEVQS